MSESTYDPSSHYDRVTEAWGLLLGPDLHYGDFSSGTANLLEATQALTDRMLDNAAFREGEKVLDVGCGTGNPASQIAARHPVEVVGVSTSQVGVESATARARDRGLDDRLSFAVRDGMDNGFEDGSFDVCWVLESSHLMRDRAALVSECARVLRAGGRVVLCDIMLQRPMPFEEVRRLREPLALLRDVFGDARMEQPSVYEELMTSSGLAVDNVVDLTEATRPTFEAWRTNAADHRDTVVDLIGEHSWQQFADSCDVLEQMWDDGTLGYGLIRATRP